MTKRYIIKFNRQRIAFGYVTEHPDSENQCVVSIVPLRRKGRWDLDSLEILIEQPLFDIFESSVDELEAINEVLAQVLIEPWKVQVQLVEAF